MQIKCYNNKKFGSYLILHVCFSSRIRKITKLCFSEAYPYVICETWINKSSYIAGEKWGWVLLGRKKKRKRFSIITEKGWHGLGGNLCQPWRPKIFVWRSFSNIWILQYEVHLIFTQSQLADRQQQNLLLIIQRLCGIANLVNLL